MNSVKLRPLTKQDAPVMANLANNIEIWKNVRDYFPHPYQLSDAETYISKIAENQNNHVFAIEFDNQFVGITGFFGQADVYRHSAEIGYWIGQPYWGKGIGTSAISQLCDIAFNQVGVRRLYAGVFGYNIGSCRLLEKAGFSLEGIGKLAILKNDTLHDEYRYSKIARLN